MDTWLIYRVPAVKPGGKQRKQMSTCILGESGLLDSNIQTEFERGSMHNARTMLLPGDIQCGDAAENSKTI